MGKGGKEKCNRLGGAGPEVGWRKAELGEMGLGRKSGSFAAALKGMVYDLVSRLLERMPGVLVAG